MKKIKANHVYIWEEGSAILGYCKISINGIKDEFGAGYEIADRKGKKVKHGLAKNRAIRQVKIQFANSMDAIRIYGKKVLDKEGNIDQQEFLKYERALERTKAKSGIVDLEEREDFTKLKDLKVKMITEEDSIKLGISNE